MRRSLWLVALLVLGAAACTGAPVQEMSDARQAVAAAEAVDADAKAPDVFIKAIAHIRHAESALENGDYKDAREHANSAKIHALAARARALAISKDP